MKKSLKRRKLQPQEGVGVLGAGLVEVSEVGAEAASSGVLGTTTPLASQVGWTTSLMMLAFFNFSTSLTMKSCFSGA